MDDEDRKADADDWKNGKEKILLVIVCIMRNGPVDMVHKPF
jgi:hypothetical protein